MARVKRPEDLVDQLRAQGERERKALLHVTTRSRTEVGAWRTVGGYGAAGPEPTFSGGWYHDVASNPVMFIKAANIVQVRGTAKRNDDGIGAAWIFFLPADHAPAVIPHSFTATGTTFAGAAINVPIAAQIDPNAGGILIDVFTLGVDVATLATVTLDGLSFAAVPSGGPPRLTASAAPAEGHPFIDTADGKLKFKDAAGVVSALY